MTIEDSRQQQARSRGYCQLEFLLSNGNSKLKSHTCATIKHEHALEPWWNALQSFAIVTI